MTGVPKGTQPPNRLSDEQRRIIVGLLRGTPDCKAVAQAYNARGGKVSVRTVFNIREAALDVGDIERAPLKKQMSDEQRRENARQSYRRWYAANKGRLHTKRRVARGSRRVPLPGRRIYAWPDTPNTVVVFSYPHKDEMRCLHGSRILRAAHMVCFGRWYGWKPHVQSTPEGVRFWWENDRP